MGYLITILLLFIAIIEYRIHKTWVAPSVCFSSLWAIISFAASLQFYNLNSVNLKTWVVIIIGVFSFALGTKIKFKMWHTEIKNAQAGVWDEYLSPKTFWILFAVVGISLLNEAGQAVRLMQSGISLSDIRRASFGIIELEHYTYVQGFYANMWRHLMYAIETILIADGIEVYLRNTRKNWVYIVASIFLVLGEAIGSGGRWILLIFLIEFFACRTMLVHRDVVKKMTISSKIKRNGTLISIIVTVIIVIVFSQINAERGIMNLGNHIYSYLCGCIPLLDLKLKDVDQIGIYSFGYAGGYGLWCFAIPAVRRLTGFAFPLFGDVVDQVMTGQEVRNIGSGRFNAFTTCFYYLYADFRFLGVFFGMLLYGIVAGNMFRSRHLNHSSISLAPYLIIFQMLFLSIQIYVFGSADNVFAFIIMMIIHFFYKSKYKFVFVHKRER